MPLIDKLPVIDNRRFDDLVSEARTRISRYAPEWTNVNDSDPGMALVQLFAWMTDQLIYRLGQTPLQSYIKFLQLVGIEMTAAQPARAEITFPVVPTTTLAYVLVPLGTQVAANGPDGLPLVFETERALTAITAELAALMTFDSYGYTSHLEANTDAVTGFLPFGMVPELNGALMFGFRYTGEFPAKIELNLTFWTTSNLPAAPSSNCGLTDGQVFPSAQLAWQYWNGTDWATLSLLKDETAGFLRSGHVYLQTPVKGSLKQNAFGPVTEQLFWIRVKITGGRYEKAPSLLAIRTNTTAALQALTVRDEVLGTSDGTPDQIFTLANKPVITGSLVLEINEGEEAKVWKEVEDFYGRADDELVYVLNRTTGEIRFGDGKEGAIPVPNLNDPGANIVARTYRYGGGAQGNVGATTIKNLLLNVPGTDSNKIMNLVAAYGGRDEETFDEVTARAPRAIRARERAVTAQDYEYFALKAADIKRAKALPLAHPGFPNVEVPGVVSVVIVPNADPEEPKPYPSEGMIRTVCAELNRRRSLTAEVYVVPPTYQQVEIEADVTAESTADLAQLKTDIDQDMLDYFHPLRGGEDGTGWPFGNDILYSRVAQRLLRRPGARSIASLIIRLNGIDQPACQDVPIASGVLLFCIQNVITLNYAFQE